MELDSIASRIVLNEAYDETYGLCDHLNEPIDAVLSSVAMHPGEVVDTYSLRSYYLKSFITGRVSKHTGLSVMEFMQLPKDMADELLELCEEAAEREKKAFSGLVDGDLDDL